MLKKRNKLVMLLVLVAFMFTIVGSAGAGTGTSVAFPDVEAGTVEAAAVYRLAGLGVLEGYPDGTFGVDKTITRAEFAKIATYVAGLQDVASGMTGVATSFPDVASDHWASGWINVASAQGFMKGYTDGSFGPEKEITQAEVVTVLMRLLGYNDNLPGVWPSNYVSQAANIDVLDDITFLANKAATRGEVAIMASETLNSFVVVYRASDNVFEEKPDPNNADKGVFLLSQSFKSTRFFQDVMATNFHTSADDLYLDFVVYDDTQNAIDEDFVTLDEFKIAESCVYSGGTILDVVEHFVEFDVNKDDEIISISVKDYKNVGPLNGMGPLNEVKVDGGKAEVGSQKYSFVNADQITFINMVKVGGVPLEFHPVASGSTTVADKNKYDYYDVYKFIMNKNGKIAGIWVSFFPTPGVVEKVDGDRVYYFENASPFDTSWGDYRNQYDFENENIFVQKDGKIVTLADLEALDTLSVKEDYRGFDYYLIARSVKLEGTLDSAEYVAGAGIDNINVLNYDWDITANAPAFLPLLNGNPAAEDPGTPVYSVDGGVTFEALNADTLDAEYDLWGQDVTVLLSATGRVAGLIFGDSVDAAKNYGVIYEITDQMVGTSATTVRTIKMIKEDGEEYDYQVSKDTKIKSASINSVKISELTGGLNGLEGHIGFAPSASTAGGALDTGIHLYNVTLKSSGIVDRIEVLGHAPIAPDKFEDDDKLVMLNSTWYDAQDVVVFALNDGHGDVATTLDHLEKTKALGWSELKNLDLLTGEKVLDYYANNSKKMIYAVVNTTNVKSDSKYGIFEKSNYKSGSEWVYFIGGDSYEYNNTFQNTTITPPAKGDVVKYDVSGSEATIDTKVMLRYGANASSSSYVIYSGKVKQVSGSIVTFDFGLGSNDPSVRVDKDTVYLDARDKDKLKVMTGVTSGDQIMAFEEDANGGSTDAVVIVRVNANQM